MTGRWLNGRRQNSNRQIISTRRKLDGRKGYLADFRKAEDATRSQKNLKAEYATRSQNVKSQNTKMADSINLWKSK